MTTVTVYYQKCPECGQTWSAQISQVEVVRIGKPVFVCKCGTAWPTGRVEWIHLSPAQRRAYFISQAEIGVLAICTLMPPLFGYFIGDGWRSAVRAAGWGLLVGIGFVLVLWTFKLCIVGASRFRTRNLAPALGQGLRQPAPENPAAGTRNFPVNNVLSTPQAGVDPPEAEHPAGSPLRGLTTGAVAAVGSHVLLLVSVLVGFSAAFVVVLPFMDDTDYWVWGAGILGTALSTGMYLFLMKKLEKRPGT